MGGITFSSIPCLQWHSEPLDKAAVDLTPYDSIHWTSLLEIAFQLWSGALDRNYGGWLLITSQ